MARPRPGPDPREREADWEVDLHRLSPRMALRRLAQELHACRLRRMQRVLVITGRGWGNLTQQPVLRPKVEAWLRGEDGGRLGVVRLEATSDGGALLVHLRPGSNA